MLRQKKFDTIQLVVATVCSLAILYVGALKSSGIGALVLLTFALVLIKAVHDLSVEYEKNYSKTPQNK